MIQRKQTLWLALISLICFSSIWINIPYRDVDGKMDGKIVEDVKTHIGFSYTSVEIVGKERTKTISNTFLKYDTLLLGLCSLASIFLYKQRKRQFMSCNGDPYVLLWLERSLRGYRTRWTNYYFNHFSYNFSLCQF